VLIVKPETVLRWHRRGWRTYWHRRSRREATGEAWVQGFGENGSQVDASNPSSWAIFFLRQHASAVWACDLFCLQTITFRTRP
jgi:hypothetical protein